MEIIKFSTNWNNKLNCKVFSTMRIWSDKIKVNDIVTIECNVKDFENFHAVVLCKIKFKLDNLPEASALLDTGYRAEETKQLLVKIYGESIWTKNIAYYILSKVVN